MRRTMDGVFVQLVWATWDRAPVLTDDLREAAFRLIGAKCHALGADMLALNGVEDRVHLLVRLPTTLSIATLMKEIKGSSGHAVAQLAMADGRFFKWQGAFGAFSVSAHELDTVVHYIKRQTEHHANQSTLPYWELPPNPER